MSDRDIAFEAYELAEKLGVPPGTDLSPLREALAQRVDNPRPAEPEWVALAPNKGTDSPAWVDRIESRNPDDRHGQRSESLCDVWPSPDGTSAFENAKRIAAALNGARTDNPEGEAKYALGRLIEYEDDRGNWHPAMITRSSYGSFTFRNLDMLASGSYANADTRVRAMTEERLIEITSAPRVDYPQGTAPDGLFVGALVRNAETGALGIVHAVRLRGASVRVGKRGKTQYWQHPEIVGQVVPPPGAPRSDSVTTPKDGGK